MKAMRALAGTGLFLLAFGLVYLAHISFFRVNVVFYAAIADALLATLIAGTILFTAGHFRALGGFEKSLLLGIWLLAGFGIAISVPTVIDRSLSFYILEKLQQRGGGIRLDRFEEVFTKEYVKEHRLVDVRLTEQMESGTIVIRDGCVMLTEKGGTIASAGRFFRKHLLPKKRLLMGTYTDALTDPFRAGVDAPDYVCRITGPPAGASQPAR